MDNTNHIDRKMESRQRSNANLIPRMIKKGEIRNPKGRGVGKDILLWISRLPAPDNLVEYIRKRFNIRRDKLNLESAILLRLAYEACKGDLKAIELWLDRKYGKVTQSMDVSTNNGPLVAILNAPAGDQNVAVLTPPPPST